MREELNHIEQIEKYLQGKMSPEEQTAFEKKLEENPQLQTEVEAQRQIMESSFQSGIKQAAEKAYKKFKLNKNLKWGGAGLFILSIVIAVILMVDLKSRNLNDNDSNKINNKRQVELIDTSNTDMENKNNVSHNQIDSLDSNQLNKNNGSISKSSKKKGVNPKNIDAGQLLSSQLFTIENGKDTIIETNQGILFVMPKNGFVDSNRVSVEGEVTLEIKEAFTADEIIRSGLSTTSNGKLLETGGMFMIDVYHKGQKIAINPNDPVVVDVPTSEKDKNMMLFDGEITEDGSINWIEPKKFDNWLTPVEITTLNFYPPNYLKKLDESGYEVSNRNFTDSLYYSFAGECEEPSSQLTSKSDEIEIETVSIGEGGDSTQIVNPINWTQNQIRNGNEVTLEFTVDLDDGWKLYTERSRFKNSGPIPLKFSFLEDSVLYSTIGGIDFPKSKKSRDPNFDGIRLPFYEDGSKFSQRVNILNDDCEIIKVKVEYMVCNEITCLPPDDKEFVFYINSDKETITKENSPCGIDPAKIKTIWNEEFNNTNLATKEFEERMKFIHKSCENEVLDLYINNLGKSLSEVDSMAANITSGAVKNAFLNFASRGDGRVNTENNKIQQLTAYYQKRQKEISQIIDKEQKKFWDKQKKLDQEAGKRSAEQNLRETQRKNNQLTQEMNTNVNEAFRQLGKPGRNLNIANTNSRRNLRAANNNINSTSRRKKFVRFPRISTGYIGRVTSTGWKNVDQYARESARTRKDLNFKDKNGKKAVIKYESCSVELSNYDKYDQVYVYFLPDGLNSFDRAKGDKGVFDHRLNELFDYDLYILAFKGSQTFYYKRKSISPKNYEVGQLKPCTPEEMEASLRPYRMDNTARDIQKDLDTYLFMRKDRLRREHNINLIQMKKAVRAMVFPCQNSGRIYGEEIKTAVSTPPSFPGGTANMYSFINDNIQYPEKAKKNNISGKVYVQFTIDENGNIINPKVLKGVGYGLDEEALRITRSMPKWEPGLDDDSKPVKVEFTLPISFMLK